jgi:hypothetical protein
MVGHMACVFGWPLVNWHNAARCSPSHSCSAFVAACSPHLVGLNAQLTDYTKPAQKLVVDLSDYGFQVPPRLAELADTSQVSRQSCRQRLRWSRAIGVSWLETSHEYDRRRIAADRRR